MTTVLFALWVWSSGVRPLTTTLALPTVHEQTTASARFRSNDKQFREFAITSPKPAYPRSSLKNKITGVVVARIRIESKGATEAVQILQSPDDDTGRAVQDAVMQWTFRPMGVGGEGNLVFYFHLKGPRGEILSPAEMREVTNPGAKDIARADEPPVKSLIESEFRVLSPRLRPIVLDIRDRETFAEGHEKGALNVPFGEILTRGPAELLVSRHIVIDCHDPPDVCAVAAHQLTSSGFSQVSILRR